jgi:hypothetical protein
LRRAGGPLPGFDALAIVGGQAIAVQAEERGVGADEAARVDTTRQDVPFFVLDRAQVAKADPRRRLDLGKLDFAAIPRLAQDRADTEV